MAVKFNTVKSIKQALIGPNILFSAAYLLFSAEVCTGGMSKNQPSSQINHIPRSSLAGKPVDQMNNVEGLEEASFNTYGLGLYQSVIPDKIGKHEVLNDLVAPKKKVVLVSDGDKVDESLVSNQSQVEDISPKQSVETKVIDGSNRPNENMDGSDYTDGPANDTNIIGQELLRQQNILRVLHTDCNQGCFGGKDIGYCYHRFDINKILKDAPTENIIEIRHFVIVSCLKASEGAYFFDKKAEVVEWFFKQPLQYIAHQYDRSILDLVIKQVKENEHAYSKRITDLVEALIEKIG
ncbi:hypothetical protein ACRRVB_04075 [Candidatus Cardinium hertigii]|uniref:hypothetical protein n=1 Tax=Candidatus Cardinium hertigii TaxID=247481 RepID=UPI003D7C69B0